VHSIIQTKCIKCGACQEACRFEAIESQRDEAIQII
jgi:MinD superfamily P-loop ATPase